MDLTFSTEQQQLRQSLRRYLQSHNSFAARQAAASSPQGWRAALWQGFAQLGILGAAFAESVGGLGGDAVDTMVIMEELGASLVIEPYLETVVIAGGLLQGAGGRAVELSRIIDGTDRYAFGWAEPTSRFGYHTVAATAEREGKGWRLNGAKSVVTGAPWATRLIVTARTEGSPSDRHGVSLFLLDPAAPGVRMQAYPTIDGRRAAELVMVDVRVDETALLGEQNHALALVERVGDAALAAIGAEALGVMRRMLEDTLSYTTQRRQFGQPVAQFQALQHRMVDMFMQLEMATSAVYLATLSLHADPAERAKAASVGKVTVGKACRLVGQNAVQLHGGIGTTDEIALAHYFKRATVIEGELGTVDYHLARYAELCAA